MFEKLSKLPREYNYELVNVFQITFVFPMQDRLSLYQIEAQAWEYNGLENHPYCC